MRRHPLRVLALLPILLAALWANLAHPAQAAGHVAFTITVKSAYLRSAPALSAPRVNSVFQGQTYTLLGRTADNSWVRLDFAGATTEDWIMTACGTMAGDLNSLPVSGAAPVSVPGAATPAPQAAAPQVPASQAGTAPAGGVTLRYTLTAQSLYLRSAPSATGTPLASLFKGQVFTAIGRNLTSQWVQILYGGTPGWVLAGAGQLSGSLGDLPFTDGLTPPTATNATPAPTPTSLPGIPTITAHMRQVYSQAAQHGRNPFAFATVGDCNSATYIYLELIAGGIFDVRPYGPRLPETVGQFYPSFQRKSVAVKGSFGAFAMFDPLWADPSQCQPDEGPFPCELRLTKASIVFIALGTGDHLVWRDFEQNYRRLIDYALQQGVLPVLVTKADDLEATTSGAASGYINGVIRRLGQEYDVPVMDFGLATQGLYNHGLLKNDFHLNVPGIDAHVLLTVQTLDAIWRPER